MFPANTHVLYDISSGNALRINGGYIERKTRIEVQLMRKNRLYSFSENECCGDDSGDARRLKNVNLKC
jgi:hypothetical protein